jgi:hypothetical protein
VFRVARGFSRAFSRARHTIARLKPRATGQNRSSHASRSLLRVDQQSSIHGDEGGCPRHQHDAGVSHPAIGRHDDANDQGVGSARESRETLRLTNAPAAMIDRGTGATIATVPVAAGGTASYVWTPAIGKGKRQSVHAGIPRVQRRQPECDRGQRHGCRSQVMFPDSRFALTRVCSREKVGHFGRSAHFLRGHASHGAARAQPYAANSLISLGKLHGNGLARLAAWLLDEKTHMRWHLGDSAD